MRCPRFCVASLLLLGGCQPALLAEPHEVGLHFVEVGWAGLYPDSVVLTGTVRYDRSCERPTRLVTQLAVDPPDEERLAHATSLERADLHAAGERFATCRGVPADSVLRGAIPRRSVNPQIAIVGHQPDGGTVRGQVYPTPPRTPPPPQPPPPPPPLPHWT